MAVTKVLERWSFPVTAALGKKGEEPVAPTGYQAQAEGSQFHIVTLTSGGELELAVSGSESQFVLEDTPKQGENGTVSLVGVSKVYLSETVTVGEVVSSNNAGEAQKSKKGQIVFGVALQSGVKGQLVPVLLHPGAGVVHA